jgi:transposase
MTPAERIVQLEAVVEQQREQIATLLERVRELEGRLAKDSHNSSKPPASDGLARKTKSLRRRSGRKPGGQIGHRGQTLQLVSTPDTVAEQHPAVCASCHRPLPADALVLRRERRQVQDLPSVRLVIREHQALHVRCSACAGVTVGSFPAETPSRAQYGPRLRALAVYLVEQQLVPYARVQQLRHDLFGLQLSGGTLVAWVREAAAALAPVEAAIKAALGQAPVLHRDATGVRRSGHLAWAHVASTSRLTHYAIQPQRGSAAVRQRRQRRLSASCRTTPASVSTTVGSPTRPRRSAATRCATSIICAN